MLFNYYPFSIRVLIARVNLSLFFLIYSLLRALGLYLNSFIRPIGRENSPTPPQNTKSIHPKNDNKHIVYTAKEAS